MVTTSTAVVIALVVVLGIALVVAMAVLMRRRMTIARVSGGAGASPSAAAPTPASPRPANAPFVPETPAADTTLADAPRADPEQTPAPTTSQSLTDYVFGTLGDDTDAAYVFGTLGDDTDAACPASYRKINTLAECEAAKESEPIPPGARWYLDEHRDLETCAGACGASWMPKGCWLYTAAGFPDDHPNKYSIAFNSATGETTSSDLASTKQICVRA